MKKLSFFFLLIVPIIAFSQGKILSKEIQIKTAVLASPEMYRENAKVWGYNDLGELIVLRKGSNDMVCLADDPSKEGINVACYSAGLKPFMARGRELVLEGKSNKEKQEIRKKDIDNGTLKMPEEPSMVYVLSANESDYDAASGVLLNSNLRYALYKPYMTAESTDLPTKPDFPGMPWLMDPGTHRSHIMITPPAE